MTAATPSTKVLDHQLQGRRNSILARIVITGFALFILSIYLMPLGYGTVTSLKTKAQTADARAPLYPATPKQFVYTGPDEDPLESGASYDVLNVPMENGDMVELALVQGRRRGASLFIDPANPEAGIVEWEGNWRGLDPVWETNIRWGNYEEAWNRISFARLLFNTLTYALVTMVGMVAASSMTAYGFARFRFPGRNILFIVVLATLILPPQVTLVPTYAFFINVLDWGGTWLPIAVPMFFGHAYHVFLLRQYFLTIPREMEEAAAIDGAGPIQTFVRIILPQSIPALTASGLFHFFYAWNDFFAPMIYLAGNRNAQPISVGLMEFQGLYGFEPQLILAAAVISMVLPLAIFFMAQRVFVQGIVITGVDK